METGNPQGYWDWWRIVAGVELLFHGAPVISARDALDRLNWMSREDFEELEIDTVVTPGGQWHDCNGIQHFDGRQFVEQQVVPTEEWYGKVVGLLQSHQDCMVVAVGYHS